MYHVIANNSDEIQLSVSEDEKGLYMPSFEVKFREDDKSVFYVDSVDWIFGEFRVALLNYKNRVMREEDEKIIDEEDWINEEYADDILEILNKGIELKWHEVKR